DGPDDEVAGALESAAEHARTRGATVAAAELCEAACRLTPPDAVQAGYRRAILAARYRWLSGDARGAATVLEDVIARAPPGRLLALRRRQPGDVDGRPRGGGRGVACAAPRRGAARGGGIGRAHPRAARPCRLPSGTVDAGRSARGRRLRSGGARRPAAPRGV